VIKIVLINLKFKEKKETSGLVRFAVWFNDHIKLIIKVNLGKPGSSFVMLIG